MANGNGANLGFENKLWQAADALNGGLDASEYKHVVLGLIFLKYVSDAFDRRHQDIEKEIDCGADPEDPDEYLAKNVFWVPQEARWASIRASAKQPTIGKHVDDAMSLIEKENPILKGVLPKDYAHIRIDKQRLGQLIDLISTIDLMDEENKSKDILGRVYEYFLSKFASAEGRKSGQFYTPQCVVRLLVEMLAPYKGRIFDPACGSGGMFVQSEKFVEAHGGKIGDISIYGQESNHTTWRLAKMNLAIRGIDGNLGKEHADSFHRDLHPDLKADYVLANPPFNDSDWRGDLLKDDKRWKYGTPPPSNANFAWVQHFIHHLAPTGMTGFVLANGSMSTTTLAELEIRKNIIEADLVDCMVALPGQLFYSTQIPVCLWFVTRNKNNGKFRDRRGQTLFIDARKLGSLVDRVHRELSDDEIKQIAETYHAWRGDPNSGSYEDIPGFCKSATIEDIRGHNHILTPGRYVGAADLEDDDEPFEEKMAKLTSTLKEQMEKSDKLNQIIWENLKDIGYGE
jgi:type I restriction enzyme M protein